MPRQLQLDYRDPAERTALWSTFRATDRQRTVELYARLALRAQSSEETPAGDDSNPTQSEGTESNE